MSAAPLRLGDLAIAPPLVLAPMAGITDRHYRRIIREVGGAGLVTMEFISSESLVRGHERTLNKLAFLQEERPLSIQIYGADAGRMSAAAEVVQEIGADVCDINMGCPANKVLKGCAGAALMGDLERAREIIARVRRRLTIPLTVKCRAGVDATRENFHELGRICEGEGVAAVALHPRTARQMFTGRAEWDRIARLKEAVRIPVVGNGDIETAADVLEMFRRTGCDAVMIGRASMKNPWIFRQAEALLAGRAPAEPTLAERRELVLRHFGRIVREEADRTHAMHRLKTFSGWYSHGLPNGRALRQRINELPDPDALLACVEGFFDALEGAPAAPQAATV